MPAQERHVTNLMTAVPHFPLFPSSLTYPPRFAVALAKLCRWGPSVDWELHWVDCLLVFDYRRRGARRGMDGVSRRRGRDKRGQGLRHICPRRAGRMRSLTSSLQEGTHADV